PIEQLSGLRAIPNMNVIRPADGNETRVAWEVAMESENTPTSLVLTRQNLTTMDLPKETVEEGVRKGAYVVLYLIQTLHKHLYAHLLQQNTYLQTQLKKVCIKLLIYSV